MSASALKSPATIVSCRLHGMPVIGCAWVAEKGAYRSPLSSLILQHLSNTAATLVCAYPLDQQSLPSVSCRFTNRIYYSNTNALSISIPVRGNLLHFEYESQSLYENC